jgi:hypothetical protein
MTPDMLGDVVLELYAWRSSTMNYDGWETEVVKP